MSDILTKLSLPGQRKWPGLLEWGRKDVPYMVARLHEHADHLRELANMLDAAADEDFRISIVRGSAVQHHVETLQEGKSDDH